MGRKIVAPLSPEPDWELYFKLLDGALSKSVTPFVTAVSEEDLLSPFKILISTVISLRTKDEVTARSSKRLFSRADTPEKMINLSETEIGELIYPAGFYPTKAKNITKICAILIENYAGKVPSSSKDLLALPGVGLKTTNLVLSLGFNIPAICVDTHVHRISNRLGWAQTKTPDETENTLSQRLPEKYWIPINDLLVRFGQNICRPISPICTQCPLSKRGLCPKIGVQKSR